MLDLVAKGVFGSQAGWSPLKLAGLVSTVNVAQSRAAGLLWQDAAKTVPAVADGDPVRVATCPCTGADYTAPSSTTRPILSTDGSHWWLLFDGVDDRMTFTGAAFADVTCFVAFRRASDMALFGRSGFSTPQVRMDLVAGKLSLLDTVTEADSSAFSTASGADLVGGLSRSGSTVSFYEGSAARGTGTAGAGFTLTALGFFSAGSNFFSGRWYGSVLAQSAADPAAVAQLAQYLTKLFA